jgi:hypothetical protein
VVRQEVTHLFGTFYRKSAKMVEKVTIKLTSCFNQQLKLISSSTPTGFCGYPVPTEVRPKKSTPRP